MTLLSRYLASFRSSNMTTVLERQKLARTMPGQTGALAANRFGSLVY